MPTRIVVFTEIIKFNEDTKEILSSSRLLKFKNKIYQKYQYIWKYNNFLNLISQNIYNRVEGLEEEVLILLEIFL